MRRRPSVDTRKATPSWNTKGRQPTEKKDAPKKKRQRHQKKNPEKEYKWRPDLARCDGSHLPWPTCRPLERTENTLKTPSRQSNSRFIHLQPSKTQSNPVKPSKNPVKPSQTRSKPKKLESRPGRESSAIEKGEKEKNNKEKKMQKRRKGNQEKANDQRR